MKWLPLMLMLLALSAPPAPPAVAWLDERHALLSWTQPAPADLCIGKIAHGNFVLIGCGPFAAGPQELHLPPFPSGNDAEVWPAQGDVYIVGGVRSSALPAPPELRRVRLPLIRR